MAWIPKENINVSPGELGAVITWFCAWGASIAFFAINGLDPPPPQFGGLLGGRFRLGIHFLRALQMKTNVILIVTAIVLLGFVSASAGLPAVATANYGV